MPRSIGVVVLGILGIAVAFGTYKSQRAIYGEVTWMSGTATLNPGGSMSFGPTFPEGTHVRYDISASLPLSTAVVESDAASTAGWCWRHGILNVAEDCPRLPSKPVFVYIKDDRSGGGGSNIVKLTIYHWGCIRNCPEK